MKSAIVTGITGQDGSYLTELLLDEGYKVIGLKRRTSTNNLNRVEHIKSDNFSIVECEVSDSGFVYSVVEKYRPDEIYNLAAQSHVKTSFDQPEHTFHVNTLGVINFLEAVKRFSPNSKFYQASTSEMFGKNFDTYIPIIADAKHSPTEPVKYQNENTQFEPQSPYAVAKLASHHLVRLYRESYGLHAGCGILFNHESERRGEKFVTRKITKWIGEFMSWCEKHGVSPDQLIDCKEEVYISGRTSREQGFQFPKLRLGNVDAYRDWGHAQDYVRAMWMMLQQETPDDYVIATGKTHSVRDFLEEAFKNINISNYEDFFVIDPEFYRPAEVEFLKGCPAKALEKLGWSPTITFKELVSRMVKSDAKETTEEKLSKPKVWG